MGKRKISNEQEQIIKQRRSNGESAIKLAEEFGVCRTTINQICLPHYRESNRRRCARYLEENRERLNNVSKDRYWRLKKENPSVFMEYAKKNKMRTKINFKAADSRRRESDPVKYRLNDKRADAKQKGVAFNLTEDWYLAHFSQGCEMTGHDLEFHGGSPWSAEIDRIDPGGDYTMDNCRIVCAIYNRARMRFSDEAVIEFAKLILSWK